MFPRSGSENWNVSPSHTDVSVPSNGISKAGREVNAFLDLKSNAILRKETHPVSVSVVWSKIEATHCRSSITSVTIDRINGNKSASTVFPITLNVDDQRMARVV